ncbi:leucyl/phenylalanyl-tRNA--protein transferase [Alteromonas sp.]|nr:leucyl/phenylalanyl-tRNA--protein transferase [Alteromonas sp.]
MITLPFLEANSPFPPVSSALDDPNGLLAYGADLSPHRLFSAYSQGIFPWFSDDEPLLWWSPTPRAIIPLDEFNASKSLRKLVKKQRYVVTLNHAFTDVIQACSTIPRKKQNSTETSTDTWITDDMMSAYINIHNLGLAHSVEVWNSDTLVGGLYGVGIGKVYCGESMFHREPNTSKLAMFALVTHMKRHGMAFIDCQLPTEHLATMGATSIPRAEFVSKLQKNNQTLEESGKLKSEYIAQWERQVITP